MNTLMISLAVIIAVMALISGFLVVRRVIVRLGPVQRERSKVQLEDVERRMNRISAEVEVETHRPQRKRKGAGDSNDNVAAQ